MPCIESPYTLPRIDFVGGETQNLMFHVYFYKNKRPFGLAGCTAYFSIVSFMNKMGTPVFSQKMESSFNEEETAENVLTITLEPKDTVNLYGKYIYQIQIKDIDGAVEIPKQGLLYITNNIDKKVIQ